MLWFPGHRKHVRHGYGKPADASTSPKKVQRNKGAAARKAAAAAVATRLRVAREAAIETATRGAQREVEARQKADEEELKAMAEEEQRRQRRSSLEAERQAALANGFPSGHFPAEAAAAQLLLEQQHRSRPRPRHVPQASRLQAAPVAEHTSPTRPSRAAQEWVDTYAAAEIDSLAAELEVQPPTGPPLGLNAATHITFPSATSEHRLRYRPPKIVLR